MVRMVSDVGGVMNNVVVRRDRVQRYFQREV